MDASDSLPVVVEYYREFRTAIFLSSLTLGTFLFTMKTFIVQTMKSDVYDNLSYQGHVAYRRSQGHKDTFYGSLRWFSRLIVVAISFAFISALIQITLGYSDSVWLVAVCLTIAALSWVLVAVVLSIVSRNFSILLDRAEDEAIRRHSTEESSAQSTS